MSCVTHPRIGPKRAQSGCQIWGGAPDPIPCRYVLLPFQNELKLSLVSSKEWQESLKNKIVDSPEKLRNYKEKMKDTVQKLKASRVCVGPVALGSCSELALVLEQEHRGRALAL